MLLKYTLKFILKISKNYSVSSTEIDSNIKMYIQFKIILYL